MIGKWRRRRVGEEMMMMVGCFSVYYLKYVFVLDRTKDRPDRKRSRSPYTKDKSRRHHSYEKRSDHRRKYPDSNDGDTIKKEYGDRFKKEHDVKEEYGEPAATEEPPIVKESINMGTSGKLCEDTNMYNGVVIKYSEPADAVMPIQKWRLYPFKGNQELPQIYIHRQSAYLIGKDKKIADFPVEHPSCSKQHAAFQYRMVTSSVVNGQAVKSIKLYVIDLGSTNGTFLNGSQIEPQRYYELLPKDILKFGFSSREYVVLCQDDGIDVSQTTIKEENKDVEEENEIDTEGLETKIKTEAFSDYGL
uniref:FHA domain-containing protein n=1 Tax=Rhabditophanes sp. KR3021 TaxID=114890 RepID=A0AC35TJ67_9BILA